MSTYDRQQLKAVGFEVTKQITPEEAERLRAIVLRRQFGLADDASEAEVQEAHKPKSKAFFTKAVMVCRMNGEQLGYLGDHIVGNDQGIGWCVAADLDAGSSAEVVVTQITGELGNLGVNIHVSVQPPPQDESIEAFHPSLETQERARTMMGKSSTGWLTDG